MTEQKPIQEPIVVETTAPSGDAIESDPDTYGPSTSTGTEGDN